MVYLKSYESFVKLFINDGKVTELGVLLLFCFVVYFVSLFIEFIKFCEKY